MQFQHYGIQAVLTTQTAKFKQHKNVKKNPLLRKNDNNEISRLYAEPWSWIQVEPRAVLGITHLGFPPFTLIPAGQAMLRIATSRLDKTVAVAFNITDAS